MVNGDRQYSTIRCRKLINDYKLLTISSLNGLIDNLIIIKSEKPYSVFQNPENPFTVILCAYKQERFRQ